MVKREQFIQKEQLLGGGVPGAHPQSRKVPNSIPAATFLRVAKRFVFLIFAWLILCSALLFLFARNALSPFLCKTTPMCPPPIGKEEAAFLDMAFYDKTNHFRPICSIHLDKIRSTCGTVGLFKTAAYKTIRITNCKVHIFGDDSETDRNRQEDFLSDLRETKEQLEHRIRSFLAGHVFSDYAILFSGSVSGNFPQLLIHGFEFRRYQADQVVLCVSGRRAVLSCRAPNLLCLEGHVILKTAEKVIECNQMDWDLSTGQFRIPGPYVLTTDHSKQYGQTLHVDCQLNKIRTKNRNVSYQGGGS